MNNNLDRIIELTQKAILESGKSFEKIDKSSILKYLEGQGISNSALRDSVYQRLKEMNSKPSVKVSDTRSVAVKTEVKSDAPSKTPRKSVFGEIKRLV